ncbi:MAG: radical SAM family heme chaperone HemW [Pseudomonadota bacterium]
MTDGAQIPGEDWQAGGFGLYLHWPFCESKCPYCDFNSHVAASVDPGRWRAAFLAEIGRIGAQTAGRTLDTVFLGGGTPSLMPPDLVGAILEHVRRTWKTAPDAEITLEANPGSVEAGRFSAYAAAGVTRVSLGVQSLRDAELRRLGRRHSVAEARAAFDLARARFDRVSFDLIYARQDQTVADWTAELREALAMAVDHLSLYQLTIEPGTAFSARLAAGGLKGLPDEDRAADLFLATQDLCEAAGLPAYEVSNHARPGAEGRHNLIYWRSGDFAGAGPGAHGRLTRAGRRYATEALRMPDDWLRAVEVRGSGEVPALAIPRAEQADELLLMGLRLAEGVDLDRHARLLGRRIAAGRIEGLAELGLIRMDGARLVATMAGRPVLDRIIAELSAD